MLYDHDFESLYVAHRMTKRIADAALEYLARRCPDLRSPTADRALNDFRLSVVAAYDNRFEDPEEAAQPPARPTLRVVQ